MTYPHNDFFDADMQSAIAESTADLLAAGRYRVAIKAIRPVVETDSQGAIRKVIVLDGTNADTGHPVLVRWSILGRDGMPNQVALREIGRSLLSAGIIGSIREICEWAPDRFPVVYLDVTDEVSTAGKAFQRRSLAKCENQTRTDTQAATAAVAPAHNVNGGSTDDDQVPF